MDLKSAFLKETSNSDMYVFHPSKDTWTNRINFLIASKTPSIEVVVLASSFALAYPESLIVAILQLPLGLSLIIGAIVFWLFVRSFSGIIVQCQLRAKSLIKVPRWVNQKLPPRCPTPRIVTSALYERIQDLAKMRDRERKAAKPKFWQVWKFNFFMEYSEEYKAEAKAIANEIVEEVLEEW